MGLALYKTTEHVFIIFLYPKIRIFSMKAVIFDMDGVIVDSEPLHVKAEKEVCRRYHVRADDADWLAFKGKTSVEIFSSIIGKYRINATPQQMAEDKLAIYLRMLGSVKLFAGLQNLLEYARQNYKVALVTSSRAVIQEAVFKKFGLSPFFDVVVTADIVAKGKPDPEPYALAMGKLGLNPEECIVIEDSDNGILSAKRAGAKVIAVTHSMERQKLEKADYIVDSLEEARHLLEKQLGFI